MLGDKMYLIKEMPEQERPRERLVSNGVKSLSNVELLAILLRTGNKNKSVIELSKDVLYNLKKFEDFKKITYEELLKIHGIKEAKATTIIAAIELGRRILKDEEVQNNKITSSHDVYYELKEIAENEQETFYCVYLNTKLNIIKKEQIYKGTVNKIVIHPREIFKNAIKYNSSYIILVHNHPTGDSNPSKADITTTEQLIEVSNIINIEILDHIIIGKNQFYSYKEKQKFFI